MKGLLKLLVLFLVSLNAATGCNGREAKAPQAEKEEPVRAPSAVVVPDSVKGKWKAVRIQVADKNDHLKKVYTLGIGSELRLPGSDLTLKVEAFLPHFVMDGTTITSESNDLANPAAQIVIREKGTEIYKGWLFSLYPAAHAYQHPRFGFTLVDCLPTG